jgi:subtilisin family serine protease
MKKTTALLLLLAVTVSVAAQAPKMNPSLFRKLHPSGDVPQYRGNQDIAVFVKGDVAAIREQTAVLGGRFKYAAGDIAAIVLPLGKVQELAASPFVRRIEDNDLRLQPLNDQMLLNSHALEVQNGWNLPQPYDGSGVIIGIIDEGIDFTHPDFRNSDGTTRIRYVWDQTIPGSTFNPQPFGYGKEFVGSQIDTSTEHFDAVFSHGSHVTGIACGNGHALNNYRGVAPGADIIVVKMNLNTSDDNFLSSLVDAVQYVFFKADSLGMPAVINVSLGTYWGSHDARDIQAQAISNIIDAGPGRALVCAAGNLGNAPIHVGYSASSDTAMTWMQYSGSPIYMQLWGDTSDFENIRFSIGVDRVQPDLKALASTAFSTVLPAVGVEHIDTLRNASGNRLGVAHSYGDYRFGSYSLEYLIYPDSSYRVTGSDTSRYLWRLSATGAGRLDAWSNDMVFDNLPDSVAFTPIRYYRRPDLDQNIVSSFSCSDKVITVGAFTNRNYYTNVNFTVTSAPTLQPGALWVQSSHGPTRDHRVKPDVVAAGDWVLSCGTRYELPLLAAVDPSKVAAGGKHKRSSGTSMSSPVVCGIGALYFQRHPTANWQDFKNALLGCTDMDTLTGSALPDNYWGYGKANAYKTVGGCAVGVFDPEQPVPAMLFVHPNPMTDAADADYDLSRLAPGETTAILFDATGRKVLQETLHDRKGTLHLRREGLSHGLYLLTLFRGGALQASSKLLLR